VPASPWLLVTVLALLGLSVLAFALGALDLLGSVASFFLGLLIATLGELTWIFLMVAFTGMSFVATRVGYARKRARAAAEPEEGKRGVRNVMGNGAAAGLVVLVGQMPGVPPVAVHLAFAAAVAAVTADTLASELGALASRARMILPPFAPAQVGRDGAVSLAGHLAAAGGALAIALLAVPFVGVPIHLAWIPAVAGFLGCQLDSLLGATLEGPGQLTKQDVNFLASAAPAAAVMAAIAVLAG
jgi:uncharacterized protein (TIGR00297 family)